MTVSFDDGRKRGAEPWVVLGSESGRTEDAAGPRLQESLFATSSQKLTLLRGPPDVESRARHTRCLPLSRATSSRLACCRPQLNPPSSVRRQGCSQLLAIETPADEVCGERVW